MPNAFSVSTIIFRVPQGCRFAPTTGLKISERLRRYLSQSRNLAALCGIRYIASSL